MTQARYMRVISLTEEEYLLSAALKESGIDIVQIFRDGLELHAPKVPKAALEKAKELIK